MTQQKLSGLQEALNSLAKGKHEILLDPAISNVLPPTIIRLVDNQKLPAVDALLAQVSAASRAVDKNLRLAAATCFVETAKLLIKDRHWETLEKNLAGLKLSRPARPTMIRSGPTQKQCSAK